MEHAQKLHGFFTRQLFFLPVAWQTKHGFQPRIAHALAGAQAEEAELAQKSLQPSGVRGLVERDQDVVDDRQLLEQANVLERARDAAAGGLVHGEAGGVVLLQRDGAARGAVYVGQKVENRGLTGAVRADQSDDLAVLHLNVELIQRLQTGEIDA